MTVTDPAVKIASLATDDLTALHDRLDTSTVEDPATVEAHHLVTQEMLKRGLDHGHADDAWARAVILVDEAEVDSIDDINMPGPMSEPLSKALANGGTVCVYLTADGYVLVGSPVRKDSPNVNTVHVDSVMGSKKPMRKRIVERDGTFVVMEEDGPREFGTYRTRVEAEERLRQVERFAKAKQWAVDDFVTWGSSGGKARGRIEKIVTEGTLNVPDSSFTLRASEEDPAVLIRVYRLTSQGFKPTDRLVGHRAAALRAIGGLEKADGYKVPDAVRSAARRALAWIADGKAGDGFTSVGRNRAKQLADGGTVGRDTLVKMRAYFARHGAQRGGHAALDDGEPTPWRVAWDAWGGDAGRSWVRDVLGAVEKSEDEDEIDEEELLSTMDEDDLSDFGSYAYLADDYEDEVEKAGNPEALRDYWRGGGKGKISWGAGGDFTACVAAVGKYMTSEQAKGYCAIRHREVTGMWPGDKRNRTKKAYDPLQAAATFTLPGGATYTYSIPSTWWSSEVMKHGSHNQKAHAGGRGSSESGGGEGGGSAGGGGGESYGGYELGAVANPAASGRPDDVVAAAKATRDKAAQNEPEITRDMIDTANTHGGEMEGLDYRMKSESSLARKIDDEKAELGGDVDATAAKMSDVVRYTMKFDEANYADGAQGVLSDLEAKGYQLRVKNYWEQGDPYQGINVAAVHPNGQKFELQFHTQASLTVKERDIHPQYETYRESRDNRTRWKTYSRMVRMANKIPVPAGVAAIATSVFQPFETASQAGLI